MQVTKYLGAALFAAFVSSTSAVAAGQCSTSWCENTKVTRLYLGATDLNILIDADRSPLSCPTFGNAGYLVLRGKNHPTNAHQNYDAIYSLLLSAHLNDRQIKTISVDTTSNPCEITYVVLE